MENIKAGRGASAFRTRYRLIPLSVLTGAVAGLTAVLYRLTLGLSEKLQALLSNLTGSAAGYAALFAALLVLGYAAGRLTQAEPLISGSGIPQVEGQLKGWFQPNWLSVLIKKFVGGAICLAAGLSLGREGPSIQLGAMSAQGLYSGLRRPEEERSCLLICGACAGLAAAFNAPLAGLMFALEELHKNFSSRAVFSAMLAAIAGTVVSAFFFGTRPVMDLSFTQTLPLAHYGLYLAMGLIMGLAGGVYNRTLFFVKGLYRKLPVPVWAKVMIPFAIAGAMYLVFPEALGTGHALLTGMAAGKYAVSFLLLLLAVKFLFSMACFCSGAPGGIFFPLLILGALTGCAAGTAGAQFLGLPSSVVMNCILLGMVGMFSSIVRAPLTGILLVVEMSGSINQLIGVGIVACVSCLTANMLNVPPVYERLLEDMRR